MSLKIENTYLSPFQNSKTDRKNIKLVLETVRHDSPVFDETERFFNNNRQALALRDSNFHQKETERNNSRSKQNKLVWLTNSQSQKSEQKSNWSISFESSTRKQKMNQVESLLQQNQLMEAFQAFQDLRSLIADQLYQSSNAKVYSKLALIEAIEALKNKMHENAPHNVPDQQQKFMPNQLKQLLEQITALRSENAKLRQKIQQMHDQVSREEDGGEEGNSILNNSISFHSYTSESICSASDQSFQMRLEKQWVKPFIVTKNVCEESTLNLLTDSGEGHQIGLLSSTTVNVNYLTSFVLGSHIHQEIQTEEWNLDCGNCRSAQILEERFVKIIHICLQTLKKLMTCYINAANLAIISEDHKLRQLKELVQRMKQYKPTLTEQNGDGLLQQSSKFTEFILLITSQVDLLIQTTFDKLYS